MKVHRSLLFILLLLLPQVAGGVGFRLGYPSAAAIGKAGAHIVHPDGPDASGCNPANMVQLSDGWQMEASLTALHLPSVDYQDNRSPSLNGSSESETFFLPQLHAVSEAFGRARFGFSLTTPFGLSKKWQQPFPSTTAREFSLDVYEAAPSLSYRVAEWLSLGGALRLARGEGRVQNVFTNPPITQIEPLTYFGGEISGDDVQAGYALAASIAPARNWALAAVYRSQVDFEFEGDAALQALAGQAVAGLFNGPSSLDVSMPAVLQLAAGWRWEELALEVVWERTFWSSYTSLDFQYSEPLSQTVFAPFDQPAVKNWEDADSVRLGLSYRFSSDVTGLLGFAYEQSPVPDATLGFDLPDADASVIGMGVRYAPGDQIALILSGLYHYSMDRSARNSGPAGLPGIDGEFTEGGALALAFGLQYFF